MDFIDGLFYHEVFLLFYNTGFPIDNIPRPSGKVEKTGRPGLNTPLFTMLAIISEIFFSTA